MGPTGQSRTLLLLLLAAAAAAAPEHESLLRLPSSARSLAPKTPRSTGAELIRALNLHPRDAFPRRPDGVGIGGSDALPAGTLVERPIRLASLVAGDDGGGGTSVSNLGHHAGYYRLPTTHDARLFYFFFESRQHKKEDPMVIWLAGGPGCSSTSGTVSCFAAYFVCNTIFSSIRLIIGNKNYYDVRKPCVGSLCYDFYNLEKFLNLKSVRQSLGVGDIEFVSCSPTVYQAMLLDWMRNLEVGIPELLENDIKVLIYAGEYDLICNWLGNSRCVDSMEWSGKKAFMSSVEKPFTVDGKEADILKSHGPLSFFEGPRFWSHGTHGSTEGRLGDAQEVDVRKPFRRLLELSEARLRHIIHPCAGY
ncbi:serine carboxypeptidase-like [Triticum dicoccoides]|uniref:serine carboxypeptidase-like n=1 Tax=Triticum dicoccoides TaxID=85692 RepID=UPI0018916329|nr:serine carboxypeptidase-like [Triticum dicoccoides]XP_044433063.1 serine carboxypeptidase-like [Triticum aestivum]XP_044445050.1 serine carboxypeptidase-like [Triticum aestivum]